MTEQTPQPGPIVDYSTFSESKEELITKLGEINKPMQIEELEEILNSTIKHDSHNKVICFLAMLNNYTEEDSINLGFMAASSTGKSYIPLELAWYFPEQDQVKLGYCSPSAFFHEWGKLEDDPLNPEHKIIKVDLHQKLLIFLDNPHTELLTRMRALLSHDEKTVRSKITDRSEKGGHRTKTTELIGFPTVIFCAAKFNIDDQEKTRLLMLSPETTQEKLKASIDLKIEKECDRQNFKNRMNDDPKRLLLRARVDNIRTAHINQIRIEEQCANQIKERFYKLHDKLRGRNQRDISRVIALIKGHALLNYAHRNNVNNTITATQEDIDAGFNLYAKIANANERGLSPELWNIFEKIRPCLETETGICLKEFQSCYYDNFQELIGSKRATEILKAFETVGLINEQPDPNDRRVVRYLPQKLYSPKGVGDTEITTNKEASCKSTVTNEKITTHTPGGIYFSNNQIVTFQGKTILGCTMLEKTQWGPCQICAASVGYDNSDKWLYFSVSLADKSTIFACNECGNALIKNMGVLS